MDAPSALAVLMATDYYLTVFAYQYPFKLSDYLFTWLWYAIVCLLGMGLLQKPTTPPRRRRRPRDLNLLLPSHQPRLLGRPWHMYPYTLAGLDACYIAGLPFYRNDLVSTALTAGALFGLPVLAARIAETLHAASRNDLPWRRRRSFS